VHSVVRRKDLWVARERTRIIDLSRTFGGDIRYSRVLLAHTNNADVSEGTFEQGSKNFERLKKLENAIDSRYQYNWIDQNHVHILFRFLPKYSGVLVIKKAHAYMKLIKQLW
jgi:hypothetical protein